MMRPEKGSQARCRIAEEDQQEKDDDQETSGDPSSSEPQTTPAMFGYGGWPAFPMPYTPWFYTQPQSYHMPPPACGFSVPLMTCGHQHEVCEESNVQLASSDQEQTEKQAATKVMGKKTHEAPSCSKHLKQTEEEEDQPFLQVTASEMPIIELPDGGVYSPFQRRYYPKRQEKQPEKSKQECEACFRRFPSEMAVIELSNGRLYSPYRHQFYPENLPESTKKDEDLSIGERIAKQVKRGEAEAPAASHGVVDDSAITVRVPGHWLNAAPEKISVQFLDKKEPKEINIWIRSVFGLAHNDTAPHFASVAALVSYCQQKENKKMAFWDGQPASSRKVSSI